MPEVIAGKIDPGTGAVAGARTIRPRTANYHPSPDLHVGAVEFPKDSELRSRRISSAAEDYQQARIYHDGKLISSAGARDGTFVCTDVTRDPQRSSTRTLGPPSDARTGLGSV
jgi:hypothetical protein